MGKLQSIPELIDLSGKHGIVTGGLKGIGQAITRRLVECGAKVLIADSDPSIDDCSDTELMAFQYCDVRNAADLASAITSAANDQGIDFIVNNAGIFPTTGPIEKVTDEFVSRMLEVNVRAQYSASREASKYLREGGSIVNVASIAALRGGATISAYSTSKAGVIGLTKSLGKELAQKNIAVNCVTPAAAKTRIFDQMTEEHINYMLSKIPRNKFAKVEELASLVTWLSSEENSFSTAAVFDLSGGRATY